MKTIKTALILVCLILHATAQPVCEADYGPDSCQFTTQRSVAKKANDIAWERVQQDAQWRRMNG